MKITKEKLIQAVKILADKVDSSVTANDALKYTQAVQNLAHTVHTIVSVEKLGG